MDNEARSDDRSTTPTETSLEDARRRERLKLFRDLIAHDLYRVDEDRLVDRLLDQVDLGQRSA
ncbi:MAG: hypothetical protein AAF533_00085 [Acidobacteriota bacterium]